MSKVVRIISGIPRYQDIGLTAYDQTYTASSTVTAGTNITLPASGTYNGSELSVYLNGQRMSYVEDYVYVGSGTRTQIQFLFDLINGDLVVFRKEL
jgi:hypothetical protein